MSDLLPTILPAIVFVLLVLVRASMERIPPVEAGPPRTAYTIRCTVGSGAESTPASCPWCARDHRDDEPAESCDGCGAPRPYLVAPRRPPAPPPTPPLRVLR